MTKRVGEGWSLKFLLCSRILYWDVKIILIPQKNAKNIFEDFTRTANRLGPMTIRRGVGTELVYASMWVKGKIMSLSTEYSHFYLLFPLKYAINLIQHALLIIKQPIYIFQDQFLNLLFFVTLNTCRFILSSNISYPTQIFYFFNQISHIFLKFHKIFQQ